MMKITERKNSDIALPPYSTCSLCMNRVNDVCVEDCAPAMDYRWFVLRKGINLEDMPPFPLDEFLHEMSPKVRQVVAAVYLSKIVDQLQGRFEYEPPLIARHTWNRNNDINGVQAMPSDVLKTRTNEEETSDELAG